MDQTKRKVTNPENQFLYLDRWVSKDSFRAFVYNQTGSKLANSYLEYKELIESGLWFPEKVEKKRSKVRRKGNDSNS